MMLAFGMGLNTGIAAAPCLAMDSRAPGSTAGTTPSPKQSIVPVAAAASITPSLKATVTSSRLYWVMDPIGPLISGRAKRLPKRLQPVSTGPSSTKVSKFRRMLFQAAQLSCAPFPGAFEPGPGSVFAQASPLHSGQALQLRIVFLAFSSTSRYVTFDSRPFCLLRLRADPSRPSFPVFLPASRALRRALRPVSVFLPIKTLSPAPSQVFFPVPSALRSQTRPSARISVYFSSSSSLQPPRKLFFDNGQFRNDLIKLHKIPLHIDRRKLKTIPYEE